MAMKIKSQGRIDFETICRSLTIAGLAEFIDDVFIMIAFKRAIVEYQRSRNPLLAWVLNETREEITKEDSPLNIYENVKHYLNYRHRDEYVISGHKQYFDEVVQRLFK